MAVRRVLGLRLVLPTVVLALLGVHLVQAQRDLTEQRSATGSARSVAPGGDTGADHTGHDGMQMASMSTGSFAASAPDLSTRGWVVRASTARRGHGAAAVLDGRRETSWVSSPRGRAPHVLTIDTRAARAMSGLRYTPEPGSARRVGRYEVQVSSDRRRWRTVTRGRWADSPVAKTARFAVVRARYVRLRATNVHRARRAVAVADIAVQGLPLSAPLARTGWGATADSQAPSGPARAVLDGDPDTSWQTRTDVPTRLPHQVTLDTAALVSVSALSYTPRQDGPARGRIGGYVVDTSTDRTTWTRVAAGTWADDATTKAVRFDPVRARYVRLRATSEAGGRGPWSAAAEINLYGKAGPTTPVPPAPALDRTLWTVTADSFEPSGPPARVLDGDPATYWHSVFRATVTPYPHTLTIDTHGQHSVSGLGYTPRQDGRRNGTIGRYRIEVSVDGTRWSAPVTSGTWRDDAATKIASFAPVTTRYVRLVALSEAGRRGPWASAAEIMLYGRAPGPLLDPAGWTVSADSADPDHPAVRALDEDPTTFWQTSADGDLPHALTVDTRGRYVVSGLTYTPRQDASAEGTIGRYRIEVSDDGTTWSAPVATGTWADDRTIKTSVFTAVTTRYVRLVALSEAGGRGPSASAAEVRLLGTASRPGTRGSWGPVIGMPIVPTSAILLPNDKVLTFAAYNRSTFDYTTPWTQVSILDVSAPDGGLPGQRQISNTGHQMFCTGLSVLADGRVLITGGSGPSNTTLYDPVTDTFSAAPNMEIPRGYQTSVTLSDGKVFTIGGSWNGPLGGKDAEVLSADATSWTTLPGVTADAILTDDAAGIYRSDNHAWLFAAADGDVFHAGPSDQMNWFTTTGDGTSTPAGLRGDAPDQMNGNAVMYDAGKILTLGGSPSYVDSDATAQARTIDITGGPTVEPVVTRQGDLAEPRTFLNSVVLPDGSVLATGGMRRAATFSDLTAVRTAELWTPEAGTFRTLAPEAVPRTYHSFSLLLADGRVLSGGGGLCGTCTVNHPDVQVMTPPYLLEDDGSRRPRPSITGVVPATIEAGATVRVAADRPVASWALVRTGTATHSINSDQRRFAVPATRVGSTNTYDLAVPADRGTAVPGTYLLFALDERGTPSVARWVRIPA